jgi:hypothetical protein
MPEIMKLHGDYVQGQMRSLAEQASEMGQLTSRAAIEAPSRKVERFSAAFGDGGRRAKCGKPVVEQWHPRPNRVSYAALHPKIALSYIAMHKIDTM